MADKKLRLVTLNTWKGDGSYGRRVVLMAQGLQQLNPDIVCLQESLKTHTCLFDTAHFLGSRLGLEVTFGPGRLKDRKVEGLRLLSYSGLAVLSRFATLQYKLTSLPSCDEDPDRKVMTIVFDWHGEPLVVTNTHLTHIDGKDTLREQQLLRAFQEIEQCVSQYNRASGSIKQERLLSFCCGDMNMEIDPATLTGLQEQSGLTIQDCYLEGGAELPGYTFVTEEGCTRRLDYIFNLQAGHDVPFLFKNSRVVLKEKDIEGICPSDHFGVMVDVERL